MDAGIITESIRIRHSSHHQQAFNIKRHTNPHQHSITSETGGGSQAWQNNVSQTSTDIRQKTIIINPQHTNTASHSSMDKIPFQAPKHSCNQHSSSKQTQQARHSAADQCIIHKPHTIFSKQHGKGQTHNHRQRAQQHTRQQNQSHTQDQKEAREVNIRHGSHRITQSQHTAHNSAAKLSQATSQHTRIQSKRINTIAHKTVKSPNTQHIPANRCRRPIQDHAGTLRHTTGTNHFQTRVRQHKSQSQARTTDTDKQAKQSGSKHMQQVQSARSASARVNHTGCTSSNAQRGTTVIIEQDTQHSQSMQQKQVKGTIVHISPQSDTYFCTLPSKSQSHIDRKSKAKQHAAGSKAQASQQATRYRQAHQQSHTQRLIHTKTR